MKNNQYHEGRITMCIIMIVMCITFVATENIKIFYMIVFLLVIKACVDWMKKQEDEE